MKKGNRTFVLFTATALLMQSLGCSPALATQSVTDRAYSAVVDSQAIVTAETTAEEVYVYGLSKEDKEEEKAAKKVEKEEEKAAKKAQKEAIKQAKEQYKYEKKVQKKKVKENSAKDSEVEWNLQMVNAEDASPQAERKIKLALIDSGVDTADYIELADVLPVEYNDSEIDDFSTTPSFKLVNLSNNIQAVDSAHYNQYSTIYNNANLTVQ